MVDELKGLSITTAEELLDEDFHSDSSSDNNLTTMTLRQLLLKLSSIPKDKEKYKVKLCVDDNYYDSNITNITIEDSYKEIIIYGEIENK